MCRLYSSHFVCVCVCLVWGFRIVCLLLPCIVIPDTEIPPALFPRAMPWNAKLLPLPPEGDVLNCAPFHYPTVLAKCYLPLFPGAVCRDARVRGEISSTLSPTCGSSVRVVCFFPIPQSWAGCWHHCQLLRSRCKHHLWFFRRGQAPGAGAYLGCLVAPMGRLLLRSTYQVLWVPTPFLRSPQKTQSCRFPQWSGWQETEVGLSGQHSKTLGKP